LFDPHRVGHSPDQQDIVAGKIQSTAGAQGEMVMDDFPVALADRIIAQVVLVNLNARDNKRILLGDGGEKALKNDVAQENDRQNNAKNIKVYSTQR
jgi:hypothetical protein